MAFLDSGKQLDEVALRLLSDCRGRVLESFEAYAPFDDPNHVYKVTRLHFEGLDLDISNVHEPVAIGPDYAEEPFAVLSIAESDEQALWSPAGRDITQVATSFEVNDVITVVDTVLLTKGSRRLMRLKLTQAVLFENPAGELLAFDRDIWSDEYLAVRRGRSVSTTTRDFRADFVAEPPFAYSFGRDIIRLSRPHGA